MWASWEVESGAVSSVWAEWASEEEMVEWVKGSVKEEEVRLPVSDRVEVESGGGEGGVMRHSGNSSSKRRIMRSSVVSRKRRRSGGIELVGVLEEVGGGMTYCSPFRCRLLLREQELVGVVL